MKTRMQAVPDLLTLTVLLAQNPDADVRVALGTRWAPRRWLHGRCVFNANYLPDGTHGIVLAALRQGPNRVKVGEHMAPYTAECYYCGQNFK